MTEEKNNEVVDNKEEVQEEQEEKPEVKYTDADVNKIVNEKFAKFKKELEQKELEKEQAIEEAKKYAEMNAEDKKKYEFEKLESELNEYKQREVRHSLSREASKILQENDINATDDVLAFIVKDDAEQTHQSVNSFVELFKTELDKGVKAALSGASPKRNLTREKPIEKDEVMKMSYTEKLKLKRENPEVYNKYFKL